MVLQAQPGLLVPQETQELLVHLEEQVQLVPPVHLVPLEHPGLLEFRDLLEQPEVPEVQVLLEPLEIREIPASVERRVLLEFPDRSVRREQPDCQDLQEAAVE